MTKKHDLIGKRFGRLLVIEKTEKRDTSGSIMWRCECSCGKQHEVSTRHLNAGDVKSCGCLRLSELKKHIKSDMVEGTRKSNLLTRKYKSNTSGITGVYWKENRKRWEARIFFKGKHYFLGIFADKQDAINARKEAEEKYFKPFLDKYSKEG